MKQQKVIVIHKMLDGTIRDSIEGVMIPVGHPFYIELAKAAQNGRPKEQAL